MVYLERCAGRGFIEVHNVQESGLETLRAHIEIARARMVDIQSLLSACREMLHTSTDVPDMELTLQNVGENVALALFSEHDGVRAARERLNAGLTIWIDTYGRDCIPLL